MRKRRGLAGLALLLGTAVVALALGVGHAGPLFDVVLYRPAPRGMHAAIPLPDGGVLLVGGLLPQANAVYTPGADRWRDLHMPAVGPRFGKAVAPLVDGRVLQCGGTDGAPAYSAARTDIFDPIGERWVAAASMTIGRAEHSATTLPDGRVLAVGGEVLAGRGGPFGTSGSALPARPPDITSSTEIYDPVAGRWAAGPPVQFGRSMHTATLLGGGQVLVVGGRGPGNAPALVGPAERFDPRRGAWAFAGAPFAARTDHTATRLPDGGVLVVGGVGADGRWTAAAERYSPADDTWQIVPPLRSARANHAAVLLPSGEVLVVGGDGPGLGALASVERFDPATATWHAGAPLAVARSWHTATLLPDGRVLVVGGIGPGSTILASTEIYDPALDRWQDGPPLTRRRW